MAARDGVTRRCFADGLKSLLLEGLGPFVDRLMGDRRVRAAAARTTGVLVAEDEHPDDGLRAPVEVPRPVPGGNEPITKGDDPPAERR